MPVFSYGVLESLLVIAPIFSLESMTAKSPGAAQSDAKPPRESLSREARAVVDWFDGHDSVAVAFSGGVDSSVVLAAALRSSARSVIAVTARSPSVAKWQLELSVSIADQLGASHRIIDTDEVEQPAYSANDSRRCFHCKSTLYETLQRICESPICESPICESPLSDGILCVSGTNADDLGDYRPGIAAGDEAGVRKPLADLGFTKAIVRDIATEFGLPNADLPASPCLASRIAYGVSVTPERLERVERAEDYLRSLGLSQIRVRVHEGELARIEVPIDQLSRLLEGSVRTDLSAHLQGLGFQYVTIDLQGFSSGSMNRQLVSLQSVEPRRNQSREML
jgi:uncharacterized protein